MRGFISQMDALEDGSQNGSENGSQANDPKKLIEKDNCIGYEKNDGFYPMTNFTVRITGMN